MHGLAMQQLSQLIRELADLEPSSARTSGMGLDPLNDQARATVNGIITEAKSILDGLSIFNEFSTALSSMRHRRPDVFEVRDLLQRAARSPLVTGERGSSARPTASPRDDYVHASRLRDLRMAQGGSWDLSKLVRLCEELNVADANDCTMSVGMLLRAIKDHCAPIFGQPNFSGVLNNVSFPSSTKRLLERFDLSLKHIADSYLHEHVRAKEQLPSPAQVNFKPELDALLAQVLLALPGPNKS